MSGAPGHPPTELFEPSAEPQPDEVTMLFLSMYLNRYHSGHIPELDQVRT